MGIAITNSGTKLPRTLKLVSTISSFMFEEEYGEMSHWTKAERDALGSICKKLSKRASMTKK